MNAGSRQSRTRPCAALTLVGLCMARLCAQNPKPAVAGQTVVLDAVTVTGTHLVAPGMGGPSPVSVYDSRQIAATGALTLADFFRYLPQNYTGIGAGRGSVPDELNPEFGLRTETRLPLFNVALGAAAATPGQTGVNGAGLRGLGSGSTLVLLDGRRMASSGEGNRSTDSGQGFVDLNTIPLGAIERVEVITDGVSAIYGGDAVGGVVNVILKKNYVGTEVSTTYRGTWHGGARERRLGLVSGLARGGLRVIATLEVYDRADLKASARAVSRQQDHRGFQVGVNASGAPVFGRDLRLSWGYPSVVQAVTGNLTGVANEAGQPVRVALTPEGTDGRNLTPAQFGPGVLAPSGTTLFASGQRRGSTAEYLDLVPASERRGGSVILSYEVNPRLEVFGRYVWAGVRGLFASQPAVSAAAAASGFGSFATVVPAAYNPFGQDVMIGMIHHEFGPVTQVTHTDADAVTAGARGTVGKAWHWEAGGTWSRDRLVRRTRDFNAAGITAALRETDPARRLNPFADARFTGPQQAALYETLATYATGRSVGEYAGVDLVANGRGFELPAGVVAVALGGELGVDRFEGQAYSSAAPAVTQSGTKQWTRAYFAEIHVPILGRSKAMPLAQRLDLHLAGRHENASLGGSSTHPKITVGWMPVAALSVRGGISTSFRAPDPTELDKAAITSSRPASVVDPRRTPGATSVTANAGLNPRLNPERSRHQFAGLGYEPKFIRGLKLGVDYYGLEQRDTLRLLSLQTLVNNEELFPGRITRAAPSASDTALGQPGAITAVDTTVINFGRLRNQSLDYRVEYRPPEGRLGQVQIALAVSRTLVASAEVAPGQVARDDLGDTYAPPRWKGTAAILWGRNGWNASTFATFLGGFDSNRAGNALAGTEGYAARAIVDLRGSYTFGRGVWRGRGQGLRLGGGIGNVFDREPPFSDTIYGFNGGLHSALGRTYEATLVIPF